MTSTTGRLAFAAGVAAMSVAFGAAANAQSDAASRAKARIMAGVQKLEAGCSADIKKFCGAMTPGEGRPFFCVMAHEDQVSSKCDQVLYTAARNLDRALDKIERVADACVDDILKNCVNSDGGGRISTCLAAKKASLSSACQSAISGVAPK